jgi:hypothetical protein
MTAVYSGTPLARKLGVKSGDKILLHNTPKNYFQLFVEVPPDTKEVNGSISESADFIHVFCTSSDQLEAVVEKLKPALAKNGMLWISWPKGSSAIPNNLTREFIREYLLDNGLVDVKVAAIDEDWSGLKFVYRLKDR